MILLLALLLGQTVTVTLPPNTGFQIQWDHEGEPATRFRLWCDGGIVKNYSEVEAVRGATINLDKTWTFTATAPGLAVGEHVCFVSAYDVVEPSLGEFKGEPATVTMATTAPPAPGKVHAAPVRFKILVTIGGG
jgi:hypothetical protein